MDMEQIDTVQAYTLESGDSIQWWDEENVYLGVKTLKDIEEYDGGAWLLLTSEDDDEMHYEFDVPVELYGYTVEEV